VDGEWLRVKVSELSSGVQSLFAVEATTGRPLGVAVYMRADLEHVTVLHVGLSEEYCAGGERESPQPAAAACLKEIRRSSRRVKGVRRMSVAYGAQRQPRRPERDAPPELPSSSATRTRRRVPNGQAFRSMGASLNGNRLADRYFASDPTACNCNYSRLSRRVPTGACPCCACRDSRATAGTSNRRRCACSRRGACSAPTCVAAAARNTTRSGATITRALTSTTSIACCGTPAPAR